MKNFKIAAGIIVLFLILVPLASFAQGRQADQTDAQRENVPVEITNIEALSVEAMQNKPEGEGLKDPIDPAVPQNQSEEIQKEISEKAQKGQLANQAKGEGESQMSEIAKQRRSKVANAVQEMLKVADRSGGIGEQISAVAREQSQNQERIEEEIREVESRGELRKFFFGPDHESLNAVSGILDAQASKLKTLKELAKELPDEADTDLIEEQIQTMEQVKAEVEKKVKEESEVFSLFGWLTKMLA